MPHAPDMNPESAPRTGKREFPATMVPAAVTSRRVPRPERTTFAVIGTGWRASFFLRLAYLLPERFSVTKVMARRPDSAEAVRRDWGLPTVHTVDELLDGQQPDFVIVCVPWSVTPVLIRQLVDRGVRVLAETPPAPDLSGLESLWNDVHGSDLVQVAEQYMLMPLHAARLAAVKAGVIGQATSVRVSSTHQYHAMAMIRALLGVGLEPASVSGRAFQAPLVDPITPDGWTYDTDTKNSTTVLASIDFGAARLGLYDFTDNQWWNPTRPDHLIIRGSHGEIADDVVVRMSDPVTPVTSRFERALTGLGMNFEGLETTHISLDGGILFSNAYLGARLQDDEIALAELLDRTGKWARNENGAPPYPLAQAIYDHQLALAIDEAVATGQTMLVTPIAR